MCILLTDPLCPAPTYTHTHTPRTEGTMPPHRSYVKKLNRKANWLLTGAVVLKVITLIIYLAGVGRRSK